MNAPEHHRTVPAETDAALAGADIELSAEDQPEETGDDVLDEQSRAVVREALPAWDVQPFQLSRGVDTVGGTDQLRASLEQLVRARGRVPEVVVTGEHVLVRVRTPGVVGITRQDVDLATALNAVFCDHEAGKGGPGDG